MANSRIEAICKECDLSPDQRDLISGEIESAFQAGLRAKARDIRECLLIDESQKDRGRLR